MAHDRIGRIDDVLAAHVEAGRLPGAVYLVRRRDDVHVGTVGTLALGGTEPMRRDTIFRLASLTKVATAVAALILVEECRIRLDEPIGRLVPELAEPTVIRARDADLDDTVPAHRAITVRDLLTFRMGTGLDFSDTPVTAALRRFHGFPAPHGGTADEFVRDLGALPLLAQPGDRWLYNTGSDVLGVLIERAAGQPFAEFLHERVLAPLGMRDTGFAVPEQHLGRVAHGYLADHVTGALGAGVTPDALRTAPPRPSPSGGLVGTVDDWFALTEMLRHGGGELLAPMTVAAMLTDQLPDAVKAASGFLPGWFDSRGWGLGIGVGTRRDGMEAPGRYGWDGGSGTTWYTDPAADLTAILLTQRGQFPMMSPVYLDFWASVHQAVE